MSKIKRLCLAGSTGRRLPLAIAIAAALLAFEGTRLNAKESEKNYVMRAETTGSNNTALDVESMTGVDPEDIKTTDNSLRETPNSEDNRKKAFLLVNMATKQFLNTGGAYGQHVTLADYGMYLWIFNNSTTSGTYNIRTRHNYTYQKPDNADSYIQYVDNDTYRNGAYIGLQPTSTTCDYGWKFEKADGYSESNKVYYISTYGNRYLTATPNDADDNLCEATTDEPLTDDYRKWKLVTVAEYYALFDAAPSDLSAPVDASFTMQNPGFNYNKTNYALWADFGKGANKNAIRYGVDDYYKDATENVYKGSKVNDLEYLYENGKYFCADIRNSHQNGISQTVPVTKPGWYIIRCNGVSNTNGLAKLFVSNFSNFYYNDGAMIATTPLNPIDANGPKTMLEAGKMFSQGKYENQVMMHVTDKDLENMGGSEGIVFGIYIDGDASVTPTDEWTVFDDFRLLYARDADEANLVLDEDNPDLIYLTEPGNTYKNTIMHLNRTFTLNKWNTLILPVNMTYGQMKRTFGDEVLLAELYTLTDNSVQFKTVDCTSDDDVMLQAFTPYIIKPTKEAGTNPSYSTPQLLKADGHTLWLEENEGITNTEDGVTRYTGGVVTVKANHYDVSGISLDRDLLKAKIDSHWATTNTLSDMTCRGTLAKTYYVKDGKGYFYTDDGNKRDNLAGDYFIKDGTMWKVPADKQYGLKGFRCWFELTGNTDSSASATAPAKDVSLYIDGVKDETTAIDDIVDGSSLFSVARVYKSNAVYNFNGQMMRRGSSTEGLPSGIYIVNGKKIMK